MSLLENKVKNLTGSFSTSLERRKINDFKWIWYGWIRFLIAEDIKGKRGSLFSDISSFQAFFNYIDMRVLLENFCVYHVNAPGQEEGAPTLPEE